MNARIRTFSGLSEAVCSLIDTYVSLLNSKLGGGGTFGVVMEATVLASSKVPIQVGVVTFKQNLTTTRALWSLMLEKQAQWTADGWGGLVTDDLAIYVNPTLNASKAADSLKVISSFV